MKPKPRQITLKIETPGRVSLEILANKTQALQRLLWNIGSALSGGGKRGPRQSKVLQTCSLFFVEANPGSLEMLAQLPDSTELFDELELGTKSLNAVGPTLAAVQNKNYREVETTFPDSGQRARVIKSLAPLAPEEDAEYDLLIATADSSISLDARFHSDVTTMIRDEVLQIPEEAVRTITGILYLIEIATGSPRIGILTENRRIECHYDQDYETIITDLVPGSLVEVEGRAILNDRGDIDNIAQVYDITPVEPIMPLTWTRVDYGNKRFLLNEQIQIRQAYTDSVWSCEFEPLGILAFGLSRRNAVTGFRADFAACWHDIAQEDDANLTTDAIHLKKKLRDLVKKVNDI
jgi:hypothetical protein